MYRVRVIYIKDMIQEKKKLLKQRLIIVSSPLVRGWYRECYFKGWGGGISGMFLFFFDFGGFREDLIGWTTWHRWPMTLMCMCAPSFLFFFVSFKKRENKRTEQRNWDCCCRFFTLHTSNECGLFNTDPLINGAFSMTENPPHCGAWRKFKKQKIQTEIQLIRKICGT